MFAGTVAFVTGSSRGIGRAIALELARRGADVAVNCRSSVSEAESVCREIREMGRRAVLIVGDIRVEAEVERMVEEIGQLLGPVSLLVNNAVFALQKPFLAFTVDEWRSQVDYKAVGYFLTARSVIPGMLARGAGVIVRVNGVMVNWAENAFHVENPEDARLLPRVALGRVTRLDEVARTVAFLASQDASGITGAIIPVDAGFLLT